MELAPNDHRHLLPELCEDRDFGGYRVEARCKGYGNPKEWLAKVVAMAELATSLPGLGHPRTLNRTLNPLNS